MIETAQAEQRFIPVNYVRPRNLIGLILTLLIAGFMRLDSGEIIKGTPLDILSLIIDLTTITVLWLIAYRYLSPTAALIAGLMCALNPWIIAFSAMSPIFSLPPLLTILALSLIVCGFPEKRNWSLFLGIFIGFLAFWGELLFVFFGLVSHPENTLFSNTFSAMFYAVSGSGFERYLNPEQTTLLQLNIPYPAEIWLLFLSSAALLGLPALYFRSRNIFILAILLGILPAFILSLVHWVLADPLMFIPEIPIFCLLAGAGVAWLIKLLPGKPYSRMIVLSAYGVIFLSQALWWRGVLRYLESL
jgi:hypothetical protein